MLKYKIKKSKIKIEKNDAKNIFIIGSHFINPTINKHKKYKLSFFKIKTIIRNEDPEDFLKNLDRKSENTFKKIFDKVNIYFIKLNWNDNYLKDTKLNTVLYKNESYTYLTDVNFKNEYISISYKTLFSFLLF